jgi:hypothetical protein
MAIFENGFKLVPAEIKDFGWGKKTYYSWSLDRFIKHETPEFLIFEHGGSIDPNLGDGLTQDWILSYLRCDNPFDFEYTAQEKDALNLTVWRIHTKPLLQGKRVIGEKINTKTVNRLCFDYRNGQWNIEPGIRPDGDIYEEVARGYVEPIS